MDRIPKNPITIVNRDSAVLNECGIRLFLICTLSKNRTNGCPINEITAAIRIQTIINENRQTRKPIAIISKT
jgi:hypothetical protein